MFWRKKGTPCFGLEFVEVSPGSFLHKGREITISHPYGMSRTWFTFENLREFAANAKVDVGKIIQREYRGQEIHRPLEYYSSNPTLPIHEHVFTFQLAQRVAELLTSKELEAGRLQSQMVYRLPTEAEYEYAAAGPNAQRYPWGNTWDDGMWSDDDKPWPVGFIPNNRSWCGAFDLLAPVGAWCLDHAYELGPKAREGDVRAWNEAPVENPLLLPPEGWEYVPVTKSGGRRDVAREYGNAQRHRSIGFQDGSFMGLRLVCAHRQSLRAYQPMRYSG